MVDGPAHRFLAANNKADGEPSALGISGDAGDRTLRIANAALLIARNHLISLLPRWIARRGLPTLSTISTDLGTPTGHTSVSLVEHAALARRYGQART